MYWLRGRVRGAAVAVAAVLVTGAALLLPTVNAAGAGPAPAGDGLAGAHIMLVNDDSVQAAESNGSDGRGLYFLRRQLCDAGADVVVVGPWGQQSGRGRASAASPQVSVQPPMELPKQFAGDCSSAPSKGAVLGVCQGADPCGPDSTSVTPADAVDVTLSSGLLEDRFGWPGNLDLVISGINTGANTDLAVNLSGTVGAAVAAVEHRTPAMAVSAGTQPTSVPNDATYGVAARYATGLAGRLLGGKAAQRLVSDSVIVNVNTPDVQPGATPPARWTQVGDIALNRLSYSKSGADTYQLSYGPVDPAPVLDPRSDTAALLDGKISVGAVSVNRDAGTNAHWLSHLATTRGHRG